ncbi:T9SS type A sorting domain-containing protein [bacterium]|nr:T9SS type A sorting domain-containing protein [bacterium]
MDSSPIFNQVTVYGNVCVLGGGGLVTLGNATPRIVNSTFWANVPDQILLFEYQDFESSTLVIANSDVMDGIGSIGLGDGVLEDLGGNIDANPLFVDPDSDEFCLLEDSPCIDAGTAFWNYNFEIIINMRDDEYFGSAPDMGACEFNPTPDVITVPGDYTTIQAAIDAAADFDTVLVSAGTYVENLNYNGKNIVLTSVSGAEETIIDGNQTGSCVLIISGEDSAAVLDGFTLTNGSGWQGETAWIGGGLVVKYSSHPTLTNLIVTGNTSITGTGPAGGGISISTNSNPYLENIVISNNTSEYGGGISMHESRATLHDVIISNNHATSSGGGMFIFQESNPELSSVVVYSNTATLSGGGIFVHLNSSPIFNQVTVVNNIGAYGGGGLLASNNGNPVIVNSIFWGNIPDQIYLYDDAVDLPNTMTIANSAIMGGAAGISVGLGTLNWGEGNIGVNPWFCDPAEDVFTLADDSPCLGTGEDGVNMGALGVGCTNPVAIDEELLHPSEFALHQNYPNPFNPYTTISYNLPGAGWVSLDIYDVMGRQVTTLVVDEQTAGYHSVQWNAEDKQSNPLEAGIYLYQIQFTDRNGSDFKAVKKFSLLK